MKKFILIMLVLLFAITRIAIANDPNLVSYWQFDEGCGNIAGDSSGNENDGVANFYCSWWFGRVYFDEGSIKGAVSVPLGKMSAKQGTILLWISPVYPESGVTPRDGYRFLFNFQGGTNDRIQMYFRWNNYLNLGLGDRLDRRMSIAAIPTRMSGGTPWDSSQWTHVALTWSKSIGAVTGNYIVYINGELAASGMYTGLAEISDGVIGNVIGRNLGYGEYAERNQGYNGLMDEFAVFNKVLLQSEIQSVMNNGVSLSFNNAYDPSPGRFAKDADVSELRWKAGDGAISHDVYLGTTNPPQFACNQTAIAYSISGNLMGATYYWRIDEKTSVGVVTTGDIWSFTTNDGKAKIISPPNEVVVTELPQFLIWLQSAYFNNDSDSHNLYFGVTNPPPFVCNMPDDIYSLSNMQYGTKYYWRVDEVIAGKGIITGDICNFETQIRCNQLIGDINGDCLVDWQDLEIIAIEWLKSDCYTIGRTPISCGEVSFVPGKYGQALKLNGINAFLDLEPDWIPTHNATFCCWVMSGGKQNCGYRTSIFSAIPTTDLGYIELADRWDDSFQFRYLKTADCRTSSSLNAGQWHHIAGIIRDMSATTCKIEAYFDSRLVSSSPSVSLYTGKWEIPKIGARDYFGNAGFFNGAIDDFRVYDYALSTEELVNVMNCTAEPNDSVVYYKFDGDLSDSGKYRNSPVYRPNKSPANIKPSEPNQPDRVDFEDYGSLTIRFKD